VLKNAVRRQASLRTMRQVTRGRGPASTRLPARIARDSGIECGSTKRILRADSVPVRTESLAVWVSTPAPHRRATEGANYRVLGIARETRAGRPASSIEMVDQRNRKRGVQTRPLRGAGRRLSWDRFTTVQRHVVLPVTKLQDPTAMCSTAIGFHCGWFSCRSPGLRTCHARRRIAPCGDPD